MPRAKPIAAVDFAHVLVVRLLVVGRVLPRWARLMMEATSAIAERGRPSQGQGPVLGAFWADEYGGPWRLGRCRVRSMKATPPVAGGGRDKTAVHGCCPVHALWSLVKFCMNQLGRNTAHSSKGLRDQFMQLCLNPARRRVTKRAAQQDRTPHLLARGVLEKRTHDRLWRGLTGRSDEIETGLAPRQRPARTWGRAIPVELHTTGAPPYPQPVREGRSDGKRRGARSARGTAARRWFRVAPIAKHSSLNSARQVTDPASSKSPIGAERVPIVAIPAKCDPPSVLITTM